MERIWIENFGGDHLNRKTKIYVILLIWGAVILQFAINRSINREEVLVEQVLSEGVDSIRQSSIKAFAMYSDEKIEEETKELIVKRVAKKLGINSGYVIASSTEEDGMNTSKATRLTKKGEQGDTDIKLISVCEKDSYGQETVEQYLMIEIDLKAQAGAAVTDIKKEVCKIYRDLGMEPSINMHMTSQIKGRLTEEEMKEEIDTYFEELNAKHISYDEFQNTIIAYGYSKDIDEFVYQDRDKVNVQIAFSYDENSDVTIMHTAVPFIDGAF